jgi:hypothetical protein
MKAVRFLLQLLGHYTSFSPATDVEVRTRTSLPAMHKPWSTPYFKALSMWLWISEGELMGLLRSIG